MPTGEGRHAKGSDEEWVEGAGSQTISKQSRCGVTNVNRAEATRHLTAVGVMVRKTSRGQDEPHVHSCRMEPDWRETCRRSVGGRKSHRAVKHSVGNITNNTVIIKDGARWGLDSQGGITS